MKKGVSSGIPETLLSGKTIIILAVITISALSFSLGYFAGKKSGNFRDRTLIETRADPIETQPSIRPDDFDKEIENVIKQDLEVSADIKHVSVTSPSGEYKTTRKAIEESGPDGKVYSVQVGVFKKTADAERLKNKLQDRGYDSYIVTVQYSKGYLYKVRADRYRSREEAEMNAARIKKIKGLDAFVLVEK